MSLAVLVVKFLIRISDVFAHKDSFGTMKGVNCHLVTVDSIGLRLFWSVYVPWMQTLMEEYVESVSTVKFGMILSWSVNAKKTTLGMAFSVKKRKNVFQT